jgi:uncharacterized membrane protein
MSTRGLLCLAVVATALVTTTSAGLAEFQVCNKSSVKEVYVAIGFYQERKGWQSEGWYSVSRNRCTTVISEMSDRYYYLYVEGDDKVWDGDGDEQGSNFCVRNGEAFTIEVKPLAQRGDNPNCEKAGYLTKRFMRVDTETYDDYTFDLGD